MREDKDEDEDGGESKEEEKEDGNALRGVFFFGSDTQLNNFSIIIVDCIKHLYTTYWHDHMNA